MTSSNETGFEEGSTSSECVKVRSVSDLAYLSGIMIGIDWVTKGGITEFFLLL